MDIKQLKKYNVKQYLDCKNNVFRKILDDVYSYQVFSDY